MKHLRTFLLTLLMGVLIVFAVSNRGMVEISLWPFPFLASMPLFFVFFFGIFLGIALAGIFIAWRGTRHYMEMRSAKKEATKLSSQIDSLEKELDQKPDKLEQKKYAEDRPTTTRTLAKKDDPA